jgi:hypothetical protein
MDIPEHVTFHKTGPNAVESSAGFTVSRVGRFELEYVEKGDRLLIEVEAGDDLAVYLSPVVVWTTATGPKTLSAEDRSRVASHLHAALGFLGQAHTIL